MVSPARRQELIHWGLRTALLLLAVPTLVLPAMSGMPEAERRPTSPVDRMRRDTLPAAVDRTELRTIARRNLFRATRSATSLPYSEAPLSPPAGAPVRPPKPAISLTGIVGGPVAAAVLEGLPGLDGARVVVTGDSAGGVRVVRITRSSVVLRGYDTLWTLGLRQPW